MAVIINLVAVLQGRYNKKLGLMALAVLALLWLTGVYLFVRPYVTKAARRPGVSERSMTLTFRQ